MERPLGLGDMPRCSAHLAGLESQPEVAVGMVGIRRHLSLALTITTLCLSAGGGFHHCSSDRGGGFCAYADITLAIKVCLKPAVPDF